MWGETLTGETRYRTEKIGFFRKRELLVLQVRVKWPDGPDDGQGCPEYLSGIGWRDAKPEDLNGTIQVPNDGDKPHFI